MDKWKPLDPTPRPRASVNPASTSALPPESVQYAPPPQSTRRAPPAHPHPPAATVQSSTTSKRKSFLPSWAGGASGSGSHYASISGGATPNKADKSRKDSTGAGTTDDVEDDRIGRFPGAVHERIIDFLPLGDLMRYMTVCKPLARIVARDIVWSRRAETLRWKSVVGLRVSTLPKQPAQGSTTPTLKQPQSASNDDWGEFNDQNASAADDSFGEFSPIPNINAHQASSSLANGTASLQSSVHPTRPGAAPSLFSYRAESSLPYCQGLPCYETVKSYKAALQPFYDNLHSGQDNVENTLLFTGPDTSRTWGSVEQSILIQNLIRAVLPPPLGSGLFAADGGIPANTLIDEPEEKEHEGTASNISVPFILLQAASLVGAQLLAAFTASSDRRADARKAAEHGVTGTEAAVDRAEGDMRAYAVEMWELGQEETRLREIVARTTGDGSFDIRQSLSWTSSADEAKKTWLRCRRVHLVSFEKAGGARATSGYKDNFVVPAAGQTFATTLNFTPMDGVMTSLVTQFKHEGETIARLFPPEQNVLSKWAEQVLDELISQYISPLLEFAKTQSDHLYLRACAATFAQSLRLAEAVRSVAPPTLLPKATVLSSSPTAEEDLRLESTEWRRRFEEYYTADVCNETLYRAWEPMIKEYLEEEKKWVQHQMEGVAQRWDEDLANQTAASRVDAAFLTAQNPAAVKRSVLTGFKDVLLLPVTVVPRTAVHVGGAVFRTAGKGVSQLNPLNWQSGTSASAQINSQEEAAPVVKGSEKASLFAPNLGRKQDNSSKGNISQGYIDFSNGGGDEQGPDMYDDEDGEDEDQLNEKNGIGANAGMDDEWSEEVRAWKEVAQKASQTSHEQQKQHLKKVPRSSSKAGALARSSTPVPRPGNVPIASGRGTPNGTPSVGSRSGTPIPPSGSEKTTPASLQRMQLLLSLDTALEMIHLNRDSLKRIETFAAVPGECGKRVQEEIEFVASSFLRCLGERHVTAGFEKAAQQVRGWDPSAHAKQVKETRERASVSEGKSGASGSEEEHVEPLVHFFELVHVGDTISQMVQVYFDQELSRHVDRTDFLNSVVREKKRFESSLDEAVASGLNAGVDLLMSQTEQIITTHQDPRDYYPEPGKDMDLGNPTPACSEAVHCLQTHCRLLVGCADKSILEVFWQEIGLRLHSILCKHLKRQIVSLDGGFKVIADLNAYHGFITSLKQPSLTVYFDALKMLGNVYIIENPRELAQLVRDASLFRGTLTPDDVYEFLQARCDFKAIEKAIDKEMYGFKISEDCTVM